MQALVYHGPGRHCWQDAAEPEIEQPRVAIVCVDAVTIGGTDLRT